MDGLIVSAARTEKTERQRAAKAAAVGGDGGPKGRMEAVGRDRKGTS